MNHTSLFRRFYGPPKENEMSDFQFCLSALGVIFGILVVVAAIINIVHPPLPPPPLSAENQAKIDQYVAEEHEYYAAQAKCGPSASGFACDKNLETLARLEVKHARWTIARYQKFGKDYDVEAQWIVAHAPKLY
jgi:hypothetical protein